MTHLRPLPIQKFFDAQGVPLSNGRLFTYSAGTDVKVTTYADRSGQTQNANPVVLDSLGACRVWLERTGEYRFVLAPAGNDDPPANPIWSVNNFVPADTGLDNAVIATGAANAISLDIPGLGVPTHFTRVTFKAIAVNTGATTLSVNAGSAHALTWRGAALRGGEIHANAIYEAIFDGTHWHLPLPQVSRRVVGSILYPPNAEEVGPWPVPVNFGYRPGRLRRWCVADGEYDDSDALQAAFNTGYPISDDGQGLFRITRKIIVPAEGVLEIKGKVRVRSEFDGISFDNNITQTAGQNLSRWITASARQGSRQITVNSVADMNPGDQLIIRTQTIWPYNPENGTVKKGEVNKIAAIDAANQSITLANPLQCEYNTSVDASYVETYKPKVADIDGLEIEFRGPPQGLGGGLALSVMDSSIRNVTIRNCKTVGISLGECYNVEIVNPTVLDGFAPNIGMGYGVQVNGSTLVRVSGGLLRNNRRGVDFSGRLPCNHCGVIGATVIGNMAEGSCVGSHGAGNRLYYSNNLFANSIIGVQSRSPNTLVQGNSYHGCTSFIVHVGAPGLVALNNIQRVNSIKPLVGINQLADLFFLELGGDPDTDLFPVVDLESAQIVVQGNVCQPQSDFIFLQAGVNKMRRVIVANNVVSFQGGQHYLVNGGAVQGGCTVDNSCSFHPNHVRTAAGGYRPFNNVALPAPQAYEDGATPTIYGGLGRDGLYHIAHAAPQTITGFDDGVPGQEITVIFSANTTIVFSNSALKGNAGVNYAPGVPFMLKGTFDGQYWYCTVHPLG